MSTQIILLPHYLIRCSAFYSLMRYQYVEQTMIFLSYTKIFCGLDLIPAYTFYVVLSMTRFPCRVMCPIHIAAKMVTIRKVLPLTPQISLGNFVNPDLRVAGCIPSRLYIDLALVSCIIAQLPRGNRSLVALIVIKWWSRRDSHSPHSGKNRSPRISRNRDHM